MSVFYGKHHTAALETYNNALLFFVKIRVLYSLDKGKNERNVLTKIFAKKIRKIEANHNQFQILRKSFTNFNQTILITGINSIEIKYFSISEKSKIMANST